MNKIILHSNIKGGVGKTSTCALFAEYLHEKGYSVKNLPLVFLPNRINTTENRADEIKQREETVKILGRIGKVTPRIKQSVVIKRYSTLLPLDKYQRAAVEHAFDAIIQQIKKYGYDTANISIKRP